MNRFRNKRLWPAYISIALIVLLWAFMNGKGDRRWDNMHISRMTFPDGLEVTGENYGEINAGPGLTLSSGWYELSFDIETDGESEILISTTNEAAVTPSRIALSPGRNVQTVRLHAIDELFELEIHVNYQSGSYIRVSSMDFVGNRTTDTLFTLTFLLAAVAILNILTVNGFLTADKRGQLMIILAAVLIASIPNLKENLNRGHDTSFHIDRLYNLINALRDGQFPARLGTYMGNRYGMATSACYPELFLYIPAAMMMNGASVLYTMHVFFIDINLVSALTMRYAAGRMLKSGHAGTLASVLYTLAVYRLVDVYTRFAVGEALAMAFLPLFAVGLYDAIVGDKKRWPLLAVSAAAIYQSHALSAALCAIAAVVCCAPFVVRLVKEGRILPIVKAVAAALCLCLFTLLPFATFKAQGVSTEMMVRWTTNHLLAPAQLFLDAGLTDVEFTDTTLKGSSLVIGFPLIIGAFAALHAGLTAKKRSREDNLSLFLVAVGAFFALMTTTLIPWATMDVMTKSATGYIQFPWRLLMFTTVCLAIAGAHGFARLMEERHSLMQFAVFGLCACMTLSYLTQEVRKEGAIMPNQLAGWGEMYEDYMLRGSSVKQTLDKTLHTEGEVTVTDYEKAASHITAYVDAQTEAEVSFPLFAFDGYAAELDGERMEIIGGEDNRITLRFAAGQSGELRIWFEGKALWRVGDAVSLITALMLAAGAINSRRKAKKARLPEAN